MAKEICQRTHVIDQITLIYSEYRTNRGWVQLKINFLFDNTATKQTTINTNSIGDVLRLLDRWLVDFFDLYNNVCPIEDEEPSL